jgi:HEAT repeats
VKSTVHRIVFAVLVVVATLATSGTAHADRVSRLIRILQTETSYKVRLQVVIALGKIKDSRAVPALIRALSDANYTVRGVAASTLGNFGDKRALAPLKRISRSDGNHFVRSQAKRAVARLSGGGGSGPPRGARFFITIGKMTNKSKIGGSRLSAAFKSALLKEFSKVTGVATPWASSKPSAKVLRKHHLKGFVLDGSIISLTKKRAGASLELSCSIRVSLATYPGNSMKAFYSGGASMAVDASSFKESYAENLYKEIVEGAAQGAKQHIVRSYLSTQ